MSTSLAVSPTERYRRALFFAHEEANRLGHFIVEPEHVLLGLIRENDSVAACVFYRMDILLGTVRSKTENVLTRGPGWIGRDMQLSPLSQQVIACACEEAASYGKSFVDTSHLLLGLIRVEEGLASQVLQELGAALDRTRKVVREYSTGP